MESEGTRRNPTLICAPIMADSVKQMVVQMNKAKVSGADLVEVRLDFLKRFSPMEDIKSLVKQCPLPTLFTYSLKDVQKQTENVDTDEDPSGWRPYYRFVDGLNEKYVKNEGIQVISDEKASTSEHSALYGCCSFMVFMLGREAAIPTMTLIVGGNLLKDDYINYLFD